MIKVYECARNERLKLEPQKLRLYCPQCAILHICELQAQCNPQITYHFCVVCGNTWEPSAQRTLGVWKYENT